MEIRVVAEADGAVLDRVAEDVFDGPIDGRWWAEFSADPRHHLVVAVDRGVVVGMATGVHYVHPDKAPELWVNEVGVAPAYRRRGLARGMLQRLFELACKLGCSEAWVLTEADNAAARALYRGVGGEESEPPPVSFSFRLGR